MSSKVPIDQLAQHIGEQVELRGWLYNKRSSGKIAFLEVRDGSGTVQAVTVRGKVEPATWEVIETIGQESSLAVTGTVKADDRAPSGVELVVEAIEVFQAVEGYPISPKEHGVEFLMDRRHLWLRSAQQHAVLRVRSALQKICRDYFYERGYVLFDSPMLTPLSVEGTTTLFETDYFGRSAFLSQSGQLYQEAGAMAFGKVFCFGPTFRAEKSKTRRHLTEFWMLEPEIAYATIDDAMDVAEDFICTVIAQALVECRSELDVLERDLSALEAVQAPFPRLHYDDSVKLLQEAGEEFEWGDDFGGGHETLLSKHFGKPVFINRFPARIKPFYMEPDPERDDLVLGCDLIASDGYGEIIGGGQRIHDPVLLESKLEEHGLPREPYEWYLDLRRYGTVPHSGFGMGLERLVAWVTGRPHLRETIPFPRTIGRLEP
ncbi:MAG: asparagine--tRNA ligase [Acidobacteria bacterium]|nr:asparagine--tRNA ligase [Acidobacteriota bacterium]